jgi:hypothetical protein
LKYTAAGVRYGVNSFEAEALHQVPNTITTDVDTVFIVQLNLHPPGAVKRISGVDFINGIQV